MASMLALVLTFALVLLQPASYHARALATDNASVLAQVAAAAGLEFLSGPSPFHAEPDDKETARHEEQARQRAISSIVQQARKRLPLHNIAVWSTHVYIEHSCAEVTERALLKSGSRAGFHVVLFTGPGYMYVQDAGGPDNWRASGDLLQIDHSVYFVGVLPAGGGGASAGSSARELVEVPVDGWEGDEVGDEA